MYIAINGANLHPPTTFIHPLQMKAAILSNYLIELIIIGPYFDTAYMVNF